MSAPFVRRIMDCCLSTLMEFDNNRHPRASKLSAESLEPNEFVSCYLVGRCFLRKFFQDGIRRSTATLGGMESHAQPGNISLRQSVAERPLECHSRFFAEWGYERDGARNHNRHRTEDRLQHLGGDCRLPFAERPAFENAKAALEKLFRQLERVNPSAARSLEEGMEETLTLHRLGVGSLLRRSLSSTNLIESCLSTVRQVTRNVKRWQGGEHIARWTAAGLLEAEKKFRRLRGYRELQELAGRLNPELRSQVQVA